MPAFDHGGPAPSPILCLKAFLFALGSPFSEISHTAISPPAALSYDREVTYLLFLNGFPKYNPVTKDLSRKIENFL